MEHEVFFSLYHLQLGILVFMIGLIGSLILSRVFVTKRMRAYEQSRWLLVTALLIVSAQVAVQMAFGIRANNDNAGALVNVLFYAPAAFCITLAMLNLECGPRRHKRSMAVFLTACILIAVLFAVGWFVYRSLDMHWLTYVIVAIFAITLGGLVWVPFKEMHRLRSRINADAGNPQIAYSMYTRVGSALLHSMACLLPFALLIRPVVVVVAILIAISLFVYVVSFIAFGFSIHTLEDIADYIENGEKQETTDLTSDQMQKVCEALDAWVADSGYCDSDMTLTMLAKQIKIPRNAISQYIQDQHDCNFRIWLSRIRFDAAKKMLLDHPEFSNDAIALSCGFGSRAQLYNLFRKNTGKSPREWVEEHLAKKHQR